MHISAALGAFVLVVPVFGAPTLVPITKRAGPAKPNSYIVTFKDAASKAAFMSSGPTFSQPGSGVTYNYDIIPAAAMMLNGVSDLGLVQKLTSVKSIEPDSIASIDYEVGLDGVDVGHPRSVGSSDQLEKRWGFGEGVDIYGIDTGIYTEHHCFGGRARWGKTFPEGGPEKDGNGHGTHTAGTAVCKDFNPGIACFANIIAVKVLSDAGSGPYSDVIAGVEWAKQQFQDNKRPAIATMSLGGPASEALDEAVTAAIASGLHFTVAAGNSNMDASTTSPARVENANTIGAVDSTNQKASFSNYGEPLDVWYYGVNVTSAWIDGPDSTKALSGTSMATPGVAAILAAVLSESGQMEPQALSDTLKSHAADKVTFSMADTPAGLISTHKLAQPW